MNFAFAGSWAVLVNGFWWNVTFVKCLRDISWSPYCTVGGSLFFWCGLFQTFILLEMNFQCCLLAPSFKHLWNGSKRWLFGRQFLVLVRDICMLQTVVQYVSHCSCTSGSAPGLCAGVTHGTLTTNGVRFPHQGLNEKQRSVASPS